MNLKKLLLLGAVLFAACACLLTVLGRTYTVKLDKRHMPNIPDDSGSLSVVIENPDPSAEIKGYGIEDGILRIEFSSLKHGKTSVAVLTEEGTAAYFRIYTSRLGILTYNNVFGDSTGDVAVPVSFSLFLAAAIWYEIKKLKAE